MFQEDTCLPMWGWSGNIFLVGNEELDMATHKTMDWIEIHHISGRSQYHTQIWRLHSLGWCFYPSCNFNSCTGSIYQLRAPVTLRLQHRISLYMPAAITSASSSLLDTARIPPRHKNGTNALHSFCGENDTQIP